MEEGDRNDDLLFHDLMVCLYEGLNEPVQIVILNPPSGGEESQHVHYEILRYRSE